MNGRHSNANCYRNFVGFFYPQQPFICLGIATRDRQGSKRIASDSQVLASRELAIYRKILGKKHFWNPLYIH